VQADAGGAACPAAPPLHQCHIPSVSTDPALIDAELQKVVERVDLRGRHVGVPRQIVERVKGR
jgi:hypothetical protein